MSEDFKDVPVEEAVEGGAGGQAIGEWEEMGIWIKGPLSLLVSATRNFNLQCNFQVRAAMVEKEKPNEMLTV